MERNMYKEKIIDLNNNEEFWRDYTPAEIAQVEKAQAESAENVAQLAEITAAKTALLAKLGITEEEAKLLLS